MTLFISERSAFRAAEAAIKGKPFMTLRVLPGEQRNADMSVDKGYKAIIVDRRRNHASYI